MKMLERAARAAAPKAWAELDVGASALAQESRRKASLKHAAATIRSIREPDEEVIEAMVRAYSDVESAYRAAAMRTAWQAGIDKITEDRANG